MSVSLDQNRFTFRCLAVAMLWLAALVPWSSGYAQTMETRCVSPTNPSAIYSSCEGVPGSMTEWQFNTGYGRGGNYPDSSEEAAMARAQESLTTPRGSICYIGPMEKGAPYNLITNNFVNRKDTIGYARSVHFDVRISDPNGSCVIKSGYGFDVYGTRVAQCKPGDFMEWDPSRAGYFCGHVKKADPLAGQPMMCRADGLAVGQPIIPATGAKWREESDYQDNQPHSLSFTRRYLSSGGPASTSLGVAWWHNHGALLNYSPKPVNVSGGSACGWPTDGPPCMFNGEEPPPARASIRLGDGSTHDFINYANTWQALGDTGKLQQSAIGFTYTAADNRVYAFSVNGSLSSITEINGWVMSYTPNPAGQPVQVRNQFGRTLNFTYDASGNLAQVITPDHTTISYSYDASNRLQRVSYPDTNTRSFHYENAGFPNALTSIDDNGVRIMDFAYDAQGRAINTQKAGGVSRYQVAYSGAVGDPVTVTDPLGTSRNYKYGTKSGQIAVISASLPSGDGSRDASSRTQNNLGLVEGESDFLYGYNTFTWDLSRQLLLRNFPSSPEKSDI